LKGNLDRHVSWEEPSSLPLSYIEHETTARFEDNQPYHLTQPNLANYHEQYDGFSNLLGPNSTEQREGPPPSAGTADDSSAGGPGGHAERIVEALQTQTAEKIVHVPPKQMVDEPIPDVQMQPRDKDEREAWKPVVQWDPLGFTTEGDVASLKRRRSVGILHAHICIVAVLRFRISRKRGLIQTIGYRFIEGYLYTDLRRDIRRFETSVRLHTWINAFTAWDEG